MIRHDCVDRLYMASSIIKTCECIHVQAYEIPAMVVDVKLTKTNLVRQHHIRPTQPGTSAVDLHTTSCTHV